MSEKESTIRVPHLLRRPVWWWAATVLFVLICAASLVARAWFGATQARLLRQNGWIVYTLPKAGMPNLEITNLASGPDGRLWVGTHSALRVFDGEKWRSFLTSTPQWTGVSGLTIDGEGRAWVTSYHGLQVIAADGQVQTIDEWHLSPPPLATDRQGRVWIGGSLYHGIAPVTTQGIGESLPGTDPNVNPERAKARVIAFGPDGQVWINNNPVSTTVRGVSVYDGTQWRDYMLVRYISITAIAFDPQERAWVAGCMYTSYIYSGCSLTSFDSQQWLRYQIPHPGLEDEKVTALAFDDRGRLWVKFDQMNELDFGLGMYDGEGWIFYQTADVIDPLSGDTNSGSALVIDSRGRLWMGVGPALVAFDIQSSLPVPDPVPDAVFERRKSSHYAAWGSGALAVVIAMIAAWASFLRGKRGQAWAQRLQARTDTMSPTKGGVRSWLFPVLSALCSGTGLVAWAILSFGPTTLPSGRGGAVFETLGEMLTYIGPIGLIGIGAGLLFYFGVLGIYRRRTPTQLVLGVLGILLGILIWIEAFLALFWIAIMAGTG